MLTKKHNEALGKIEALTKRAEKAEQEPKFRRDIIKTQNETIDSLIDEIDSLTSSKASLEEEITRLKAKLYDASITDALGG